MPIHPGEAACIRNQREAERGLSNRGLVRGSAWAAKPTGPNRAEPNPFLVGAETPLLVPSPAVSTCQARPGRVIAEQLRSGAEHREWP